MSSDIINKYEGQEVGDIVWPFYRYSALIPQQLGGDLFVWLYISLVIFYNEGKSLPSNNYSEEVKIEVQKILNDKFGNVIDGQTMRKIIGNAEQDFVETIIYNHNKSKQLKPEAFSFINTYENLFSDKLEIKYIYQDAITGEVLPFFDDTSFIYEPQDTSDAIKPRESVKEPSASAVKKAYEMYIRIKKYNTNPSDVEVELADEFYDKDEQTFIDDGKDEETFENEKKEVQSLKKYNVIFLKDKKALFYLQVGVFIEDNNIVLKSPFGNNTNQWINKCLKKGRNVSDSLDTRIKQFEEGYLIDNKVIDDYIEGNKQDIASTLNEFQVLYRLINQLGDNRLREYVIKLDHTFTEKNAEAYYQSLGNFLERMLKKIPNPNKSTEEQRRQTTFEMFCREIENKFYGVDVRYNPLMNKNIYDDWVKKYKKKDGSEFSKFKADLTDILLRTDLVKNQAMYPSFIEDIFDLYKLRNDVSHDNDRSERISIDKETPARLTKCAKVLFEII